jgi:hypothetical protein
MSENSKKNTDSMPPSQEIKTTPVERIVSDVLGTGAVTALAVLKLVPGTWALTAICLMVLPSSIVHYLAKAIAGRVGARGASLIVSGVAVAAGAKKALAGVGVLAVLTGFMYSCAAIHAAGNLSAIHPRVIEREEYGTCLETGGSYQRSSVRFSLITQACVDMDAGNSDASARADAGASIPENASTFDIVVSPLQTAGDEK